MEDAQRGGQILERRMFRRSNYGMKKRYEDHVDLNRKGYEIWDK